MKISPQRNKIYLLNQQTSGLVKAFYQVGKMHKGTKALSKKKKTTLYR